MKKIKGIPVSGGIGIGKAFVYDKNEYAGKMPDKDPRREKERYLAAAQQFAEECVKNALEISKTAGESAAKILLSHASLAKDEYAVSNAVKLIESGMSAQEAAKKVWGEWKEILLSASDSVTRERAADADDVMNGILSALFGKTETEIPADSVLVTDEFTPSLAAKCKNVAAVVANKGSVTSHGAILAVGMGLPCVMGIEISGIKSGEEIICDGENGEAVVSPDAAEKEKYEKLKEKYREKQTELKKYAYVTAVTGEGKKISVECNAGSLADVTECVCSGGDGVGLFRTEFLFSERNSPPGEEEQFLAYRAAAQMLCGREMIVRTLDIGGDKKIPYFSFPREDNPFLGLRGIRWCLANTEVFRIQLRALLRASLFGNVKIMLPMVAHPAEIEKTKELISECRTELSGEGVSVPENISLGIMTETPAAALCAAELARHADFFSIGTNDLTQYVMAADRGNGNVKYLYDTMSEPVKRAVEMTAAAARNAKIPCHVCGEAAADESFLGFVMKLGIDGVSVSPARVAQTKKSILTGCRAGNRRE